MCGWGEAGQGHGTVGAHSSAGPMRELEMHLELTSETGSRTYACTHGDLEVLSVWSSGLVLAMLPFALTSTSTAVSSVFHIVAACLLLFISLCQRRIETLSGLLQLVVSAAQSMWKVMGT